MKPHLTIVIPTYNESIDIASCLESIAMQKFDKNKFEVIIVDNYSSDKTVEIAKKFSKKIKLRVLFNKIKDAETSKMKGLKQARGDFFMYLDADMTFADEFFIDRMLNPLYKDPKIAGVFVRFLVNPKHSPLTRTLSYDAWQRDPIFKFFTVSPEEIITKKIDSYYLCELTKDKIPPQGLMIYRKKLIENYIKNKNQLIDNDIPVALFNSGNKYFAYVPQTGVYHYLLRSLSELSRKRMRNLQRTYFPNQDQRLFKWIDWKKDWSKIGIWLLYTFSFILPIFGSIYKTLKYRDICLLNEAAINLVSTSSIVYAVLKNEKNKI
mgnify:FL=1